MTSTLCSILAGGLIGLPRFFLVLLFCLALAACLLELQVVDGQIYDLGSQVGFFDWVGRRRVVALPLEPEEILVVLVFA